MLKEFYRKYRREIWSLAVVFAVVFAAQLTLAAFGFGDAPARYSRPDTAGYLEPARALAEHGAFNISADSSTPMTDRPPLFPLLLAALLKISGGNFIFIAIVLCFLSTSTVVPVYLTGRLFASPRIALTGASLFGFNITAIAQAPMLLTDMFFTLFVAWQLYFFTLFYFRKKLRWCYIAIAIAALSVLVRPIAVAWICPAVFLIAIMPGLKWRPKLTGILISCLIFFAVITPWMYRNYCAGAGFTIDTNTGAMYHQNGAMLLAKVNGTSYEDEKQRILTQLDIEFADKIKYPDIASQQAYRIRNFRALILQYPVTYFSMHFSPYVLLPDAPTFLELLGITQSDRGTLNVLKTQGIFAAVNHYFDGKWSVILLLIPLLLISLITYAGAICQLIRWLIGKNVFLFFFFLAFVEYFLFLPGPITVPRYQLPTLPLLAVMAAITLGWICGLVKEKMRMRL